MRRRHRNLATKKDRYDKKDSSRAAIQRAKIPKNLLPPNENLDLHADEAYGSTRIDASIRKPEQKTGGRRKG